MSVEVTPLSMKCNLRCTYCYENTMRDAETVAPYDMDAMTAALRDETKERPKDGFTVFGGEPLLVPIADLEKLLALAFELSGRSGLQTNGSLITEAHIALFKKYKTHVGFSVDGPGELNDARASASPEATRVLTDRSLAAFKRLLAEDVGVSLIVTLHKWNVSKVRWPIFVAWLNELRDLGFKGEMRLHLLEVDSREGAALQLTEDEAVGAMIALHRLEPTLGFTFDVFREMLMLLRGKDDRVTCIWGGCDPSTTGAVRGVGPQGERTNCQRTNKDGVNWLKADRAAFYRQVILHRTPQDKNGCKGCRFFVMCKGQCPGEAINGDWRNRSSNCRIWYRLLAYLEQVLVYAREQPVSLRPDLKKIEDAMVREWAKGNQPNVSQGIAMASAQSRGGSITMGPNGHGDVPHGDSHGDSWGS